MKPTDAEIMIPWVRAMARLLARQGVINHMTGVTPQSIKEVWKACHGRSSPSGLTPNDLDWYLKTPTLRYQAALILLLYHQAIKHYPAQVALTCAYYHFATITSSEWDDPSQEGAFRNFESDYTISFARAHRLVTLYTDDLDRNGNRFCSLKIKQCRSCTGKYLSREEEQPKCPICQ